MCSLCSCRPVALAVRDAFCSFLQGIFLSIDGGNVQSVFNPSEITGGGTNTLYVDVSNSDDKFTNRIGPWEINVQPGAVYEVASKSSLAAAQVVPFWFNCTLAGLSACVDGVDGTTKCFNTASTKEHCGGCGQECPGNAVCFFGNCRLPPGAPP